MSLSYSGYCGKGINCGFPNHLVMILELSVNDLKQKTSVSNESCYQPSIDVVELTCTKHSAECHNQGIETNGSSEDSSS